ncbi:hypothetical protein Hamer_G004132 [Homarus americanus]|uniref:Uncharacterized protein n=1 Tax=Homarus americanus TaxID=6706 RepID=A0A8J5MQ26_HOMAM|nr:hypothetical protein Hamer_G004132 [Homarus americanus]
MTVGVSPILLLLVVCTLSTGGWAGGGDAINTKRGVEDQELHQHPEALHPPHSPTPLRVTPLHSRVGALSDTDTLGADPHTSLDKGHTSGLSLSSSPHSPRSSTSQQFFQSSSLYQPSLKTSQVSWATGGRTTAGRQPYHLSELPPSSPPPQVPLWPDPPPAAPPSSTPAAEASPTLSSTTHSSTTGARNRGSLLTNHNTQRKLACSKTSLP